jgi:ABC-type lipopolysaccharide export system ATPase subunit
MMIAFLIVLEKPAGQMGAEIQLDAEHVGAEIIATMEIVRLAKKEMDVKETLVIIMKIAEKDLYAALQELAKETHVKMEDVMMIHVARGIHALKGIHAQMDIARMMGMEMAYLMMKNPLMTIVMALKEDVKEIPVMRNIPALET